MPVQIITAPASEPIHLNEALLHIKQDAGNDDAHVMATVSAARKAAETKTWRQLVGTRCKQVMDSFPGVGQSGVPWGRTYTRPGNSIFLDRLPVVLVESIQYLAMDGTEQTVNPAAYTVDYSSEPCRITPVFGQIWPIPMPQIGAVWVTFIAGFAAPIVADSAAGTLTVKGPWKPLIAGDTVRLSNSGGALPAPLVPSTDYFIQSVVSAGVYKLASTSSGAAITLTDAGTGQSFFGEIEPDILAWVKLRIGSLDQFREEAAIMNRGSVNVLPFVDGLLDAYAHWW